MYVQTSLTPFLCHATAIEYQHNYRKMFVVEVSVYIKCGKSMNLTLQLNPYLQLTIELLEGLFRTNGIEGAKL